MNLIQIEGAPELVYGFTDIPDIALVLVSTEEIPGGNVRTSAYATDWAITEIETRGAMVTVVMDNDALDEHLAAVFENVEPDVG